MTSEKIVEICKGKCIEDFLAIWQSQGKSWEKSTNLENRPNTINCLIVQYYYLN